MYNKRSCLNIVKIYQKGHEFFWTRVFFIFQQKLICFWCLKKKKLFWKLEAVKKAALKTIKQLRLF